MSSDAKKNKQGPRKQGYPPKVQNRRRGPANPSLTPLGTSPKCRRVFTPFFYRKTPLAGRTYDRHGASVVVA
jgi:hypothetical protein